MKRPAEPLDPAKFTVVPHVAVIDEFRMTNADGTFVATINPEFIDKLCAHMNEREAATGDLAVLIVGHTPDEWVPETEQPPVVGYARNWVVGDLFETGRKAAFVDVWVFNEDVEQVRKHPRRSAEVYADRYEIDQIAVLGATTPARDLGLMKLSRRGSLTVNCPGELEMPEPKKDDLKKPEETGESKGLEGKLDQILAKLTQLLDSGGAAGPKPTEGAPTAGAPGTGDEPSDEELEKMLSDMDAGAGPKPEDEGRAGEKPTKNSTSGGSGYPGGNDTNAPEMNDKVKKLQDETNALRVKLARREVREVLTAARAQDLDVNPDDEALVTDCVALPDEMRARYLDRIVKNARALPTKKQPGLDTALANAVEGGVKRPSAEDTSKIIKLARDKGLKYEQAAAELGFDPRSK